MSLKLWQKHDIKISSSIPLRPSDVCYISTNLIHLSRLNMACLPLSVCLVFIVFIWHYLRRPRNAPPGPKGLPFVGSYLSLGDRPDLQLKELASTYGNVLGLYLGLQFTVVLNDVESVREAFLKKGDSFSGRPSGGIVKDVNRVRAGKTTCRSHGKFTFAAEEFKFCVLVPSGAKNVMHVVFFSRLIINCFRLRAQCFIYQKT